MKIVLSAHFDLKHPVPFIKVDNNLSGLLDNFSGVFVAYQVSRATGAPLYLTNFEETTSEGAKAVANLLDPANTLIIVVDTKTEVSLSAYFGNVYGFDTAELKKKFSDRIEFRDGFFEEKEDETAIYGAEYGFKTFYFGVPTPGDYHDTDNIMPIGQIDKTADTLIALINWFKQNL